MPDSPMKIVVIGTINKDIILPFEGAPIQSFGGIYYTITALSTLASSPVEIIPVSFMGNDVFPHFTALLSNLDHVDKSGLIPIDQKNHEVILEYSSPEERSEKALFNFPPLEWKNIKKNLKGDFYIINMITGWDLSLKAFQKLSKKHFERMYLDVHFLVMGMDKMGKREPHYPENIIQWLRGARFLQMNAREFGIINKDNLYVSDFFDQYLKDEQILIITHGSKGAQLIFTKNNMVRNKDFPAYHVDKITDVTGCGDVFGAAFVLNYLKSEKLYDSVDFANHCAAVKCMLKGTNEMDLLTVKFDSLRH